MALNKDLSTKQIVISISAILIIVLAVGAYYVVRSGSSNGIGDLFKPGQSTEYNESDGELSTSDDGDGEQDQKDADQLVDKARQAEREGNKQQAAKDYQAAANRYKSSGDKASAEMVQKMADNLDKTPKPGVSNYELLPQ